MGYFPGLLFRLRNITLSSLGRLSVDCVVHERVENRRAEPERGWRYPEGHLRVGIVLGLDDDVIVLGFLGCNSIDTFLGPETCPSHFWSSESKLVVP